MPTQIFIVSNDHERLNAGNKNPKITYGPFNPKYLVILRPTKCFSKIAYHHEGQNKQLLIRLEDPCYGVNPVYKYGTKEPTGQDQICYQISPETESLLLRVNDEVHNYFENLSDKMLEDLPASTRNSFKVSQKLDDLPDRINCLVKPAFTDKSRIYVKIDYDASLVDKSFKEIDRALFVNKKCHAVSLISLRDIYFGAHGSLSCGASVRYRVTATMLTVKEKPCFWEALGENESE